VHYTKLNYELRSGIKIDNDKQIVQKLKRLIQPFAGYEQIEVREIQKLIVGDQIDEPFVCIYCGNNVRIRRRDEQC